MQTVTKTTATVKFAGFTVKYASVTVSQRMRRPAESDPRREQWDRAAKLIWRLIICLAGFVAVVIIKKLDMENSIGAVFMADRMPEIIREIVEYIKKL